MRILHVGVGNLGPGGVRTYLDQVSEAQRAKGLDVEVVELFPDPERRGGPLPGLFSVPELVSHARRARADIVHLHSQIPGYEGLGPRAVLTAHEHSAYCPAGSKYLERSRRECRIPYSPLGCLVHHYLDRCGSRHPASLVSKFRLTRRVVDFEGTWIAPSEYTASMLRSRGLPPDRIRTLANPGPAPVPAGARTRPREGFLFVGRLVPNKGCDVAIRAAASVPDARLSILGDGPLRGELQELARACGAESRVEFAGWLPREDVLRRLGDALALVVPSLWPEPFGLVALEAFARRTPVVASALGGLLDIVRDGINGRLFSAGDPGALAGIMEGLLAFPDQSDRLGNSGAEDLGARFRLDRHIEGLDAIYDSTLEAADR